MTFHGSLKLVDDYEYQQQTACPLRGCLCARFILKQLYACSFSLNFHYAK